MKPYVTTHDDQGAQGAAGAPAKQPVEILFWSAGNQRVTDWWHAAAENGVHKKWPHITVNSVVFPPGNREDKLVTAAAAGNPPDFSVGHSTILNRLAQLGAVAPLDSSISQHKVPMQDYLPYHVAAGQFDGKQYGLCAYGGFFHTGFNKSLLDSKGAGDPKADEAAGNWTVRSFLKPQFDIVNYLCDEAYTEAEGNPELKRLYGFNSASRPPDLPTDAVPVRRL